MKEDARGEQQERDLYPKWASRTPLRIAPKLCLIFLLPRSYPYCVFISSLCTHNAPSLLYGSGEEAV